MKELGTGNILLRSNSTGDLYPFHSTHGATIPSSPHSAFLSSSIWHSRLGHPGNDILHSLSSNSIQCNETQSFVCHSCPLGKHVRLASVNSQFVSTKPFDIIHSDVWSSPVSIPSGYKYYVLFLDHYTNFLWTFPLFRKYQVYDIFVQFNTFVNTQFDLNIKPFQCDYGVNLIIKIFSIFVLLGVSLFFSLAPKLHPKMENSKEKFAQ